MSVPSVITDLSATAASNSPAGSDAIGTTLDDFLRAGFAFSRALYDTGAIYASTVGGTANAITLAVASPLAPTAYKAGQSFSFIAASSNTGAATVNVNSIGAKDVKKSIGGALVALVAGDIQDDSLVTIRYDGTQFQLASPPAAAHGADVASASTIDLDAATGDLVDVTGTTTITAITLAEGRERTVRFTGALTLTNGPSLVLPGGASITTAAGDFATFRGYSGGVVRCTSYARANGTPVGGATYKVGTFTRDVSTASGTQAITGVGFKPKAVIFLAGNGGSIQQIGSVGFDDGSTHACVEMLPSTQTFMLLNTGASIAYATSTTANSVASIQSMDSDGFTLTWTKTSTPTGTATIAYMALR